MSYIPVHQRGYTNPELLAESNWLAEHLDDPNVRIVDARPPKLYVAGHIPGAMNLGGTNGIPRTADGEMASPEEFSLVASKLGIGKGGSIEELRRRLQPMVATTGHAGGKLTFIVIVKGPFSTAKSDLPKISQKLQGGDL